jgi:hypothetical protein
LRAGLALFAEREFRTVHKDDPAGAIRLCVGDDRMFA